MLYVSSELESIRLSERGVELPQDEVTITFKRVTPGYYAWLHQQMQRLPDALRCDKQTLKALNRMKHRFNMITQWAERHYGRDALDAALRELRETEDEQ